MRNSRVWYAAVWYDMVGYAMWVSGPPRLPFKPHPTIMIHPGQQKCMECVKRFWNVEEMPPQDHKLSYLLQQASVFDVISQSYHLPVRPAMDKCPEELLISTTLHFKILLNFKSLTNIDCKTRSLLFSKAAVAKGVQL